MLKLFQLFEFYNYLLQLRFDQYAWSTYITILVYGAKEQSEFGI